MPEILVLDEPTSGLDPIGKMEVFSVVHDLKRLLRDYYKVRDWDKNGYPTKEKLKKLKLGEYIKAIYK